MNLKKVLVSGVAAGIVMMVVSLIANFVIQLFWTYDILSLPGIRGMNDPLMMLFLVYPLILGIIMAAVYQAVQPLLKQDWVKNGQQFGVMIWLLVGFTSGLMVVSSMNYPFGFYVDAFISSFIYLLAGSLVIAKLNP